MISDSVIFSHLCKTHNFLCLLSPIPNAFLNSKCLSEIVTSGHGQFQTCFPVVLRSQPADLPFLISTLSFTLFTGDLANYFSSVPARSLIPWFFNSHCLTLHMSVNCRQVQIVWRYISLFTLSSHLYLYVLVIFQA